MYRFGGRLHRVTVDDKSALLIPLREHMVEEMDTMGIAEGIPIASSGINDRDEDGIAGPDRSRF